MPCFLQFVIARNEAICIIKIKHGLDCFASFFATPRNDDY